MKPLNLYSVLLQDHKRNKQQKNPYSLLIKGYIKIKSVLIMDDYSKVKLYAASALGPVIISPQVQAAVSKTG